MLGLGLSSGSVPSISSIKSKADAMKFALEFTVKVSDDYTKRTLDYEAAEELFNFICKHVQLPDVEELVDWERIAKLVKETKGE